MVPGSVHRWGSQMLSILLILHSQMLAVCPQTADVQLHRQEDSAGGEWLHLISLARSKMFPRNQAAASPLHPGGHDLVTWPCRRKQVFVIFVSHQGKEDFLTRKKRMGMTVSRKPMVSSMATLKKDEWHVCGRLNCGVLGETFAFLSHSFLIWKMISRAFSHFNILLFCLWFWESINIIWARGPGN